MKTRNKLHYLGPVRTLLLSSTGIVQSDVIGIPTYSKPVGSVESLDSVEGGKFIPGQLRLNPVIISKGIGSMTNGRLFYKGPVIQNRSLTVTGPYNFGGLSQPSGSFESSLSSYLLAKAYAKTKDADLELFVMAGELGETIQLLNNPMKALKKALRKAPNYRVGERLGDAASGSWLTWLYGVKPLISDISDIIDYATKKRKTIGGIQRKRARGEKDESGYSNIATSGFDSFAFTRSDVLKRSHVVTAIVYYNVNLSACDWTSRVLGYSWPQLPGNLWELVTKSFVVDWILDVGSWIRNMTPDPVIQYLGNCVSDKCTTVYTSKVSNPTIGGSSCSGSPSDYTWIEERLERRVNLSLPALPAYSRKYLELQNLLTSLALLWGDMPRNWRRR
jgi:hypothetical protein